MIVRNTVIRGDAEGMKALALELNAQAAKLEANKQAFGEVSMFRGRPIGSAVTSDKALVYLTSQRTKYGPGVVELIGFTPRDGAPVTAAEKGE